MRRRIIEEWKKKLTPEQYHVLREKGTEPPFSGKYLNEKASGMYVCVACGAELFSSETKFDSNTGWPSFTEPVHSQNIELKEDTSYGMDRVEVLCKKCGCHLGHVFDKAGGGQHYCINSMCLDLKKN